MNALASVSRHPTSHFPPPSQPEITLSSFKGKSDVVLVFYCYDWGTI